MVAKVDEAGSLGGLITTLIRHGLPLAFSTDGHKVPEDIHIRRPHSLVSRVVELARQGGAEANPVSDGLNRDLDLPGQLPRCVPRTSSTIRWRYSGG